MINTYYARVVYYMGVKRYTMSVDTSPTLEVIMYRVYQNLHKKYIKCIDTNKEFRIVELDFFFSIDKYNFVAEIDSLSRWVTRTIYRLAGDDASEVELDGGYYAIKTVWPDSVLKTRRIIITAEQILDVEYLNSFTKGDKITLEGAYKLKKVYPNDDNFMFDINALHYVPGQENTAYDDIC